MYPSTGELRVLLALIIITLFTSLSHSQYVVVPGDSLYSIAQAHNVDLAVLEALNPTIPNFNLIFPGQVINLPKQSGGTHIVEEGDSLYALALAFNIDFTCLIDGNRQLANPNLIFPGDVISIPATCPPFNPAEVPPITVTQITHITTISTVASSKPPEPSPVTGIVIGGTTYPIGTGSSTITQSDGSTIIFGPGGVVIGTQTVSLPPVTRPTTFTSGGQTITLGTGNGPTITTRPQTSSEIVIEGSTYTIGPDTITVTEADGDEITIGPSGITMGTQTLAIPTLTGSSASTIITNGITLTLQHGSGQPTNPSSEIQTSVTVTATPTQDIIVIGTQTFTIGPLESTVVNDGTTYIIGGPGGDVVVGTQTFSEFPTGSTTLTSDGITLTVGPAPSITRAPGQGGNEAIFAIQPMASQLVNLIAAAAAGIGAYSALQAETAAALAELTGLFTSAAGLSGAFVAAASDIPLDTLTSDGRRVVTEAISSARASEALWRDALRLLLNKLFTFRRKAILLLNLLAVNRWVQLSAGILLLAAFLHDPGTSSTLSITETETPTTTTTSTSTTTTKFPAVQTEWFLATEPGTSLLAFKALQLGLPESGIEIVQKDVPFHGYVTNMTFIQAVLVSLLPFVSTVWLNDPLPGEADGEFAPLANDQTDGPFEDEPTDDFAIKGRSNTGETGKVDSKLEKRIPPFSGNVIRQRNSPKHLKVASQSPQNVQDNVLPNYQYDSGGRNNVVLYVVDRGFDLQHIEFRNKQPVRQILVSSAIDRRIQNGISDIQFPDNRLGKDVHGTSVASVAIGARLGLAKDDVDWVAVKYKEFGDAAPAAIFDAFTRILQDVVSNNLQRKAIINLSTGFLIKQVTNVAGYMGQDIFQHHLLPQLAAEGIVFVLAAGNDGLNTQDIIQLEDRSPQKWGGEDTPMIIVGGTNKDGTRYADTTTSRTVLDQLLSISAFASNVETADARDPNIHTNSLKRPGTSFAAPVVAALAGYYMGVPGLYGQTNGQDNPLQAATNADFVMKVKEYLIRTAHSRHRVRGQAPNGPIVAYNQAILEPGCNFNVVNPRRLGRHRRANVLARQEPDPGTFSSEFPVCTPTSTSTLSLTTSELPSTTSESPSTTSSPSSTTSETPTKTARPVTATFGVPVPGPTCQNPGLRQFLSTRGVSMPTGAPTLILDLDIADQKGAWEAHLGGPSDATKDIAFWQVKAGNTGPLLNSGTGDSANVIKWTNNGETGTEVQYLMKEGLGIEIFAVTVTGRVNCIVAPTGQPTTTTQEPPASTSLGPITPTATDGSIACADDPDGAGVGRLADCLWPFGSIVVQGQRLTADIQICSDNCIKSGQAINGDGITLSSWCMVFQSNSCAFVIATKDSRFGTGIPDNSCISGQNFRDMAVSGANQCGGTGKTAIAAGPVFTFNGVSAQSLCLTNPDHPEVCAVS